MKREVSMVFLLILSMSFLSAISCGDFSSQTPVNAIASEEHSTTYSAKMAIDGKTTTFWFGKYTPTFPKIITLDIGSIKCINGVNLNFYYGDVPLTFNIEVSEDNSKWIPVLSNLVVSQGSVDLPFNFSIVSARYVRIVELSAKRYYGTLAEAKITSAELISSEETSQNQSTQQTCTANCSGKECGNDGCGGVCGSCNTGSSCISDKCVSSQGTQQTACNGCLLNNLCLKQGIRFDSNGKNYCEVNNQIVAQKQNSAECLNDFECLSNSCLDGKCTSLIEKLNSQISLLKQILCGLLNDKGSSAYQTCLAG